MINPEMLLNIQTSLPFSGTISCTILFMYNYIYLLPITRNHKHTHNPDKKKPYIQTLTWYTHLHYTYTSNASLCFTVSCVYTCMLVSLCVYYNILPHFPHSVTVCAVSKSDYMYLDNYRFIVDSDVDCSTSSYDEDDHDDLISSNVSPNNISTTSD